MYRDLVKLVYTMSNDYQALIFFSIFFLLFKISMLSFKFKMFFITLRFFQLSFFTLFRIHLLICAFKLCITFEILVSHQFISLFQAQGDDDDVAVGVEEKGGYMEEFFQEVLYNLFYF